MELRLGDLLVDGGVLNAGQVEEILEAQKKSGEPFGVLAERLCGVDPAAVEAAWAHQYARIARNVDPTRESFDEDALALVTRRQAWQFRVLPIRFDPHELMIATTRQHLPRALRFACSVLACPTYFVIAAPDPLGRALCKHYPLAGLTPRSVVDDGLDHVVAASMTAA